MRPLNSDLFTLSPSQFNNELPQRRRRVGPNPHDDPPPLLPPVDPAEPDESDEVEVPWTDDAYWDVFIADDGDPLPEPGDFWIDDPDDSHAKMCAIELL